MNHTDKNIGCDIQCLALIHCVAAERSFSNMPVSFYLLWQTKPLRMWAPTTFSKIKNMTDGAFLAYGRWMHRCKFEK